MSIDVSVPEFRDAVAHLKDRCTPRELFRSLLHIEEHVHYFEPAFKFVIAALDRAAVPSTDSGDPIRHVTALIDWATADLSICPTTEYASSWPTRVAREFAPVGLTDGAWLQGAVRANVVESEVGMAALKQLMIRFGDPGSSESYVQRYGSLLRSIGVAPASISRWERDDASPCVDISYEHALLGLALGLFPCSLGAETLGFNLWMATLGPCPLLVQLADELRKLNACLRYFEMHDRQTLQHLATQAAVRCIEETGDDLVPGRIARGFAAAHHSYRRWEEAMLGRNVPMNARDFVLELIRQKAHFAIGHHSGVPLGDAMLEDLFRGDETAHEALLEHLAASGLICPGAPDDSRFISQSISIDGPMFDVFTASEQRDLREWIAALGTKKHVSERKPPVTLEGEYTCPQDPGGLQNYAFARYGGLSMPDLLYYCANSDQYPAIRLFAKTIFEFFLAKLSAAFENDHRLAATPPPKWSERGIAEMVAERHSRNIQSRKKKKRDQPSDAAKPIKPFISIAFDGAWRQGFADVHRSDCEEYGWLFRIYASEQGDGNLAWNHNLIARKGVSSMGCETMLPATNRQLYNFCVVEPSNLLPMAASLNTRHFMPGLLECNLGIEATGVGGSYLDGWRKNLDENGNKWAVLTYRLHNSIDNYATGHTKWSLAAIQSFMARVRDSAPAAVEAQWQRIWRLWRIQEIIEHGADEELKALSDVLGFKVSSLAPTDA